MKLNEEIVLVPPSEMITVLNDLNQCVLQDPLTLTLFGQLKISVQ